MSETHLQRSPIFRAPWDRGPRIQRSKASSERRSTWPGRDALDAALAAARPDLFTRALLDVVRAELDVDTARLVRCGPEAGVLVEHASVGIEDAVPVPIPVGDGLCGWAAEHRCAAIVDDARRVRIVTPALRRLRSAMVAPVFAGEDLAGVLEVGTFGPRAFDDEDLEFLQAAADRAALAIDRDRLAAPSAPEARATPAADRPGSGLAPVEEPWVSVAADGTISDASAAAGRLAGRRSEDLEGMPLAELFAPADRDRLIAALHRAATGIRVFESATLVDDEAVILELQILAAGDAAGMQGAELRVALRDAREADPERLVRHLESERAHLVAVLQHLPAGVIIAEAPSGRILRGNACIAEILRHPVLPSTGVEAYGEWTGLHPDGRPVQASEWPLARAIRAGEVIHGEEYVYIRGDGTRTWISVNAAPIRDADGHVVAGVAVLHDIGREKRAVDELRFLADASSALHSSLDIRTTLRELARLAVPRFADWCAVDILEPDGRLHRQETAHSDADLQRRIERKLHRRGRIDAASHPFAAALRRGESVLIPELTDANLRGFAADDEHLELLRSLGLRSAMIVPMPGRARQLGLITFVTSGSRWRYGERDLALAEEVARRAGSAIENAELFEAASEANRAKSDFLAVMSHELRTPLAAIMGYAELLQIGIPTAIPEPALKQVERIDAAARHQLQLVEEILTFSRLSAGEETVTAAEVDLADLVREAAAFIRPAAEQKELSLELDLSDQLRPIRTDNAKLRQVLINLLFNAVQFTSEGRISVSVEQDEGEVRIAVRDTGIGIAPEHQRRIFDAFWQVRQSSTREVGGSGLGLTVAQRMAQILGGEILVRSVPGEGSTFTVRLAAGSKP
jgi:signal transduction histidine kinase/PAS domain-containing protein